MSTGKCCGVGGVLKSVDAFAWRRKARGQRDNMCRPCRTDYKHRHYAMNRQRYVDQARERKRRLTLERTEYLLRYFEAHPCTDCGESDPVVLEFDHLRDKVFNIGSALPYRNWKSILVEIEKCEVVCANCHRRRTARSVGSMRAAPADAEARSGRRESNPY